MTARRYRFALAVAVAVWIALRIAWWNGYYTEDSPGYVTDAIWAVLGEYHARTHVNGLNVGTYLPVALPIALFGKTDFALGLWPLACSCLGLLALARTAQVFFGMWAGLLAAFLYATYPGDVFFSTVVMPDAIQSGWIAASIALVASAFERDTRARGGWLFGAGVAVGVCHLARASDVLLLPVGVLAVAACGLLWSRDDLRTIATDTATFIGGWAAIVAAESLAYWWAIGDPLLRLHVVQGHYGTTASIARAGLNTDWRTIPFSLFAPIEWWLHGGWGRLNPEQAYHGLLFCWAVAGVVVIASVALTRTRAIDARVRAGSVVAVIWLAWPIVYHEFGSQSLTALVPMHRLSRHLVVYAPGAILAIAAAAALLAPPLRGAAAPWRYAAAGMALVFGVVHLSLNWQGEKLAYRGYHEIKDTYARIRDHLPPGTSTIVGDPGDLCFFDFWLNPVGAERVKLIPFANYNSCDQLPRSVVLTYCNPGWSGGADIIRETVRRLPCLERPPDTWRQLYQGYPERVYQVPSPDGHAAH